MHLFIHFLPKTLLDLDLVTVPLKVRKIHICTVSLSACASDCNSTRSLLLCDGLNLGDEFILLPINGKNLVELLHCL